MSWAGSTGGMSIPVLHTVCVCVSMHARVCVHVHVCFILRGGGMGNWQSFHISWSWVPLGTFPGPISNLSTFPSLSLGLGKMLKLETT